MRWPCPPTPPASPLDRLPVSCDAAAIAPPEPKFKFPSRDEQMDTLTGEMAQMLFELGLGDYLIGLRDTNDQSLLWPALYKRQDPLLFDQIVRHFPEDELFRTPCIWFAWPPTPVMIESVKEKRPGLLARLNGLRSSKDENPIVLRAALKGEQDTALALASEDRSVLKVINKQGVSASMFLPASASSIADKMQAWETFVQTTESRHHQTADSLAVPVRALRALNNVDDRTMSPTIVANIIATGDDWGINFGRAPTKEEWVVIHETLDQIGRTMNFYSLDGSKGPFDHLREVLFNVTPSWSVSPQNEDAYLNHRQNAFIGAAVAAVQKSGTDLDDDQWKNMGSHVNLTATQAKTRYEWLESQWR